MCFNQLRSCTEPKLSRALAHRLPASQMLVSQAVNSLRGLASTTGSAVSPAGPPGSVLGSLQKANDAAAVATSAAGSATSSARGTGHLMLRSLTRHGMSAVDGTSTMTSGE